ncbi:MAG: hypothetical protein JWN13_7039 [Betaproteobacteria bacterium]|nr:hypothetical protein [Betaproteobacteria bacterium]
MLPSWRDEVRIALSPDHLAVARVSRRWRPKVVAKHVVRWPGGASSHWQTCVEALNQVLREPAWQRADACVVLSNHFVRYALVPWSEHLVTDEEKRAWVAHHFIELYGEPAAALDYRWADDRANGACIASAVESDLVASVRAAFESTSLRLRSVQPYLMAAFNRCRKQVKGASVWVVLPESGRVCIATTAGGTWQSLTCKGVGPDWESEVSLLLERRLLLAQDELPSAVLAYGPSLTRLDLNFSSDIPFKVLAPRALPGYSPHTDSEYGLALTGVV